jgi:hypothetical protein
MENSKEIRQNNSGQSQGQLTQASHAVNVLKNVSDFDEINQEISYSFLCKKTEKLATALYLITGFLSDNEPIKWSVREAGLSTLADVTALGNSVVSETTQRVKKIMSDIEKVVSLLEISATAGFISEMNLAVLKEEYLSLVQTLANKKRGGLQESFVFSRDFFSVRGMPKKESEENYKGHIKDTTNSPALSRIEGSSPDVLSERVRNVSSVTRPSVINRVRHSELDSESTSSVNVWTTPKKQEMVSRKDTIINLIKQKGIGSELSIKDITTHFTDCGEKTIQRELATLVATNVLKKTGDRRWSKYSLA